jgi:hypothetical protein
MKTLTKSEIKTLAALTRRAIETNQIELVVRSPFASKKEMKAAGETVNERFDGNATNATGGLVLVTETQLFAALDRGDDDNDQPAVAIYIPQHALDFLNPTNTTEALIMESALDDLQALSIGAKREHLTRDNLAATMHARIVTAREDCSKAKGGK